MQGTTCWWVATSEELGVVAGDDLVVGGDLVVGETLIVVMEVIAVPI